MKDRLQKHIDKEGETLYRIADNAGIDVRALYRVVNGQGGLTAVNALWLMGYLGISTEEVTGGQP